MAEAGSVVTLGQSSGVVVNNGGKYPGAGRVWVRFGGAAHPTSVPAQLLSSSPLPPNSPGPVKGAAHVQPQ